MRLEQIKQTIDMVSHIDYNTKMLDIATKRPDLWRVLKEKEYIQAKKEEEDHLQAKAKQEDAFINEAKENLEKLGSIAKPPDAKGSSSSPVNKIERVDNGLVSPRIIQKKEAEPKKKKSKNCIIY